MIKWLTLGALNSTFFMTMLFFSQFSCTFVFRLPSTPGTTTYGFIPKSWLLHFTNFTPRNFYLYPQVTFYPHCWALKTSYHHAPSVQIAEGPRYIVCLLPSAELGDTAGDESGTGQPSTGLLTLSSLHLTNLSGIVWEDTCRLGKQNPLSSYNPGSKKPWIGNHQTNSMKFVQFWTAHVEVFQLF